MHQQWQKTEMLLANNLRVEQKRELLGVTLHEQMISLNEVKCTS